MSRAFPFRTQSSPDSIIGRWLAQRQPHPESFACGVRVVAGQLAQQRSSWTFRVSAVDPYIAEDRIVRLYHGSRLTLALVIEAGATTEPGPRPGHQVFGAREQVSQAQILVSVPVSDLVRFGVEPA